MDVIVAEYSFFIDLIVFSKLVIVFNVKFVPFLVDINVFSYHFFRVTKNREMLHHMRLT